VLYIKQRYWNAAANVLGTAGVQSDYESVVGGTVYYNPIYQIGWGNSSYPSFGDDPLTASTFYRHANYDTVNNAIVWNSTNSDHTIPASLLYSSKPGWLGDRPWPSFDPANPSVAAVTSIPAGYRFVFGSDPPSAPANLLLLPPIATTNGWKLSFTGTAGTAYQLQRAISLFGPWTNVANVTAATNGVGVWVDIAAPATRAFYRVMSP
jgi:hypothetical protein